MKFTKLKLFGALLSIFLIGSCSNDTTVAPTTASVSALSCSSATFSAAATASAAYTGTATVPYTGGNGAAYTASSAVSSTGVTGLTATLVASTLASGTGNATYAITGTPSGEGTATFAVSLGGQTCALALSVAKSSNNSTGSAGIAVETDLATIVKLAEDFKATLTAAQLATVQLTYTKANAVRWSNLPEQLYQAKRVGLQTSTLSTAQWTALKALLKAAMGTTVNEGSAEMDGILAADDYLNSIGGGAAYGSGNYYIGFLGTPSTTGLWMMQFGGHHGTQFNTYNNGKLSGATPSFRSTEPFPSFTLNSVKYNPFEQEIVALSAMLKGLSTSELASAKIGSSLGDIQLGPAKDGVFPTTKTGLKISGLTAAQKTLVLNAIQTYVGDLDAKSSAAIMAKYTSELDNTYISYAGSTDLTAKGDYVLIDGPNVWIEFNMQGGIIVRDANHPHSVWRDRTGDYGGN